ncbi:solute carrier family 36 (proton-coupled amino acid transporter), partial [Paragonimus westermani]
SVLDFWGTSNSCLFVNKIIAIFLLRSTMPDSEKTSIADNEHLPTNTSDNSSVHSADEDGENIMLQTHDPHVMGDHLKESQALMNFIKGNIGTGMLSMPVVLRYAGLWTGFFMILIAGSMAAYLMKVLVRTSRSIREQHTVNLFLIVTQIGFSCVYTLFITENIRYFIHGFFPQLPVSFYLVAFLVCLALTPMCLCSDMRVFARISAVANVATLLGSILIFIYLFTSGLQPLDSLPVITNPQGMLVAFGIVMFSFEGISLVLPIESKMENPDSYIHPCGVLNVGMIIIIALNVAFGFFGFMRFGEDAKGTITLNIPEYPYWFSPVKPLFIIAIMVTYLLQFYIPASIFSRLMEKLRCHREASDRRRYINLKLMRIGLVMFAYLMVVTIPKLDLMISLIGAFASSMLAFILPPVLELVHLWERRN